MGSCHRPGLLGVPALFSLCLVGCNGTWGRGLADAAAGDAATAGDAARPDAVAPADGRIGDAAHPPDGTAQADACVPAGCGTGSCGSLPDGCGATLDCGACPNLGESCGGGGVPNQCGSPYPILLAVPGCFHYVDDVNDEYETSLPGGTTWAWIAAEFEAVHGGWREDVFDRPVLNHNLFGMWRDVSFFPGRFIFGNAAQCSPPAPLNPRSIFYGRVDLEQKPPGLGYTGYQSFINSFPFQVGETYTFRMVLDPVGQQQTLEILVNGQIELSRTGDIPYIDPSITSAPWIVRLAYNETDEREVMPVGWEFCNLLITGEPL